VRSTDAGSQIERAFGVSRAGQGELGRLVRRAAPVEASDDPPLAAWPCCVKCLAGWKPASHEGMSKAKPERERRPPGRDALPSNTTKHLQVLPDTQRRNVTLGASDGRSQPAQESGCVPPGKTVKLPKPEPEASDALSWQVVGDEGAHAKSTGNAPRSCAATDYDAVCAGRFEKSGQAILFTIGQRTSTLRVTAVDED
jgi:hypothetical protein